MPTTSEYSGKRRIGHQRFGTTTNNSTRKTVSDRHNEKTSADTTLPHPERPCSAKTYRLAIRTLVGNAEQRTRHDLSRWNAVHLVAPSLRLLREKGFADVDCYRKRVELVLLMGLKAGS